MTVSPRKEMRLIGLYGMGSGIRAAAGYSAPERSSAAIIKHPQRNLTSRTRTQKTATPILSSEKPSEEGVNKGDNHMLSAWSSIHEFLLQDGITEAIIGMIHLCSYASIFYPERF